VRNLSNGLILFISWEQQIYYDFILSIGCRPSYLKPRDPRESDNDTSSMVCLSETIIAPIGECMANYTLPLKEVDW